MSFVLSGISLGVWSGVTAGIGAAILFPKISFMRAAVIGGGSVTASAAVVGVALLIASMVSKDLWNGTPGAFESFLKNWTWVGFIPLIAVPYFAGVSAVTGIALVALGMIGGALKAVTVGVLPDK